jgi:L(+)-tartrate dehydratase alpha subunit
MERSLFVPRETAYGMFRDVMMLATKVIPSDVRTELERMLREEPDERARLHLDVLLENCNIAERDDLLACPDTGSMLYYVRAGDSVRVEGGFSALADEARRAVKDLTASSRLRPNMVHPLTRVNTGTNVGAHLPMVEIRFDPRIDALEIVGVPKGGGSEIFGTFYRMLYPSDGIAGVMKFVLDCVARSTYAGATCPPNVIGIGIGGTADICMRIAKEAAVLRPVGSRHPDADIAELESRLLEAVGSAGIGPMGMGGRSGVLDVHIEYAVTHTAALPVAFNAQCSLCRRKVARFDRSGEVTFSDVPQWDFRA